MGFQSTVFVDLNEGVAGSPASLNPFSTLVQPRKAGAIVVQPGKFVWGQADGTYLATGVGKPTAFAILTNTGKIGDTQEASMDIQVGYPVTGAYDGDWYARSVNTAVVGNKVYAALADGSIKTQAAGVVDALLVETDFVVSYVGAPGTAGSAIIITRH
jgi:hypothetical protein